MEVGRSRFLEPIPYVFQGKDKDPDQRNARKQKEMRFAITVPLSIYQSLYELYHKPKSLLTYAQNAVYKNRGHMPKGYWEVTHMLTKGGTDPIGHADLFS